MVPGTYINLLDYETASNAGIAEFNDFLLQVFQKAHHQTKLLTNFT